MLKVVLQTMWKPTRPRAPPPKHFSVCAPELAFNPPELNHEPPPPNERPPPTRTLRFRSPAM